VQEKRAIMQPHAMYLFSWQGRLKEGGLAMTHGRYGKSWEYCRKVIMLSTYDKNDQRHGTPCGVKGSCCHDAAKQYFRYAHGVGI